MRDIRITPSILNADLNNLDNEIAKISKVSDLLHLDIMDNKFVPNLTWNFEAAEEIIRKAPLPVDAHLMIEDPDRWACDFADAGADSITFHLEAAKEPTKIIKDIHNLNKKVGVAIKPKTSFEQVKELLPQIDVLLVMTVEPGFGGQKFMDDMLQKVEQARKEITKNKLDVWLQVDGGVGFETIEKATKAGADFLVVGSAAFATKEPEKAMTELRNLAITASK